MTNNQEIVARSKDRAAKQSPVVDTLVSMSQALLRYRLGVAQPGYVQADDIGLAVNDVAKAMNIGSPGECADARAELYRRLV